MKVEPISIYGYAHVVVYNVHLSHRNMLFNKCVLNLYSFFSLERQIKRKKQNVGIDNGNDGNYLKITMY